MSLWSALRDMRYALPAQVERWVDGPDAASVARMGQAAKGMRATYGYFPAQQSDPDQVMAANQAMLAALRGQGGDARLAVKAPHLGFDAGRIAALAGHVPLIFDAHAPAQADATLALATALGEQGAVGCALPARWRRSMADAADLRDGPLILRVVQGEWADPDGSAPDKVAYLELVRALAGRRAMVGIATHDPTLGQAAMQLLLEAGTPCEWELLRGLPRRRCRILAQHLGVPVRLYWPFGPGWWPYAVDKALARPYLPLWAFQDHFSRVSL
ncbi:proline dehydrogenase [Novosphingobium umbonatum]|uniref:Proline dehydrogenase n=1 Tax=Novosphingobium umbonatum TaxID=1908524 RepID=A0A3S2VG02_9SPHN|nr:proline dehydrogenase [Novosphingobium umbonatum]RVU07199.1 proline dehydrogenase [Novosphingobium umbonatum]